MRRLLLDTQIFLWSLDQTPLPLHHRDPFDRPLIAQALDESLTLVTVDPAMRAYDITVL